MKELIVRTALALVFACLFAAASATSVQAQVAVSANDGKMALVDGATVASRAPTPDTVT